MENRHQDLTGGLGVFAKTKQDTARKRHYHKMVSYSKYGYLFLIPFFVVFAIFQLVPLGQTFYYSFFQYYFRLGITQVGPNFVGWGNFAKMLSPSSPFWQCLGNTLIIWIIGFVPQIITSLLLAIWFTDARLKLKCSAFFKAITYMPNLVMAAAFGMMFLMLFGQSGPINQIMLSLGWIKEPVLFTQSKWWTRVIISFIDWLMWFGNTAILLMSGIMGIDDSIFESARLDGAGAQRTFWQITMPLLMPIFVYVLITSMIGGLQLFDAAQIFTQTTGGPESSSETLMMYLYNLISVSLDYGLAGALSVIIFLFTAILSIFVFKTLVPNYKAAKAEAKAYRKRQRWLRDIKRNPEMAGGKE
jgi:cellobiose transport system permease protein